MVENVEDWKNNNNNRDDNDNKDYDCDKDDDDDHLFMAIIRNRSFHYN